MTVAALRTFPAPQAPGPSNDAGDGRMTIAASEESPYTFEHQTTEVMGSLFLALWPMTKDLSIMTCDPGLESMIIALDKDHVSDDRASTGADLAEAFTWNDICQACARALGHEAVLSRYSDPYHA